MGFLVFAKALFAAQCGAASDFSLPAERLDTVEASLFLLIFSLLLQ